MSKVEHKREDKANQKVKEALQKASHMFMGDIGKRVEEDELILKKKIELKTKNMFSTIDNEIPDYFIDERKRRKLLEDLKIKYRKRVRLPEDIQEEEEQKVKNLYLHFQEKEKQDKLKDQKVEEDDDDDRKATSEVLAKIEEEKKDTALKKMIPAKFRKKVQAIEYKQESTDGKLVPYKPKEMALDLPSNASALNLANALNSNRNAIVLRKQRVVQPEWHAPWKLMRVISGHQGWVRAIAVDVTNKWFVTGSRDRTIKFWDLVEGNLLLTLTGHISTVRGLWVSETHPYLFSCGEDKQVMWWDLEQNKVVRKYHGHLSGVYSIALHPSLDLLMTGSRDSTWRVWDMRTKAEVHCLSGHGDIVSSIIGQDYEPQVITGSHDKTIKLWDIGTGRKIKTLTHHKKSIRAMACHHEENTFASGAGDKLRQWALPEGEQMRKLEGHNSIINSLSLNKDNVLVSGGDNGTMYFWDWKSGYNFQSLTSQVQPGSLSSEAGIFASTFDRSGLRLLTGECDKTIKIWKQDDEATPETHPVSVV